MDTPQHQSLRIEPASGCSQLTTGAEGNQPGHSPVLRDDHGWLTLGKSKLRVESLVLPRK